MNSDNCKRVLSVGAALSAMLSPAMLMAQANAQLESITYHDNASEWVVGQIARKVVMDPATGASFEVDRTEFDAKARAHQIFNNGKLQSTFGYHSNGSLASVVDGRNQATYLDGWKRGVPQVVQYHTGEQRAAVINNNGTVASITDENGYKTCYEHDRMLRLAKVTYPSESVLNVCDASFWTPTTITFASGYPSVYGMPAGHWRQTVLTGNGRKVTVLDALWRPLVEQALDLNSVAGTTSEVINRFDSLGRLAFQSYPMNTGGSAVYTDTALKGVRTRYDALSRVVRTDQDSELGVLATDMHYQVDSSGPYLEVVNPKQERTRTWFQMFDQPSYQRPVAISHPEGAYTDIGRDVLGKPTLITRRNAAGSVSAVRSYAYNAHQELCRVIEPETGATLSGYDPAGNLAWTASGLPGMTACDTEGDTAAIVERKVNRTYDTRNRIESLTFPDGRGNTSYSYWPDGQLKTLIADNPDNRVVTSSYQYNRRRLLTHEILQWGPVNWPVDYTYSPNGHLTTQAWHGLTVDYAPNALGQPTRAGSFASGLTYHPNGAIKQFTYGNGIVHTMTQNDRGLPDTSKDAYGSTAVLYDGYDYDANGNVAAISDGLPGNRGDRTMSYDGLDRLKTVTSPMFGAAGANYSYDVLDNLTHVLAPGRNHYYCYDSAWRLTNIKTGGCGGTTVVGLGYDVQGNVENKNGAKYTFDFGNRLRTAPASSLYAYDGQGRRVWDFTADDKYSHYSLDGRLVMTADERAGKVAEYIHLAGRLVAIRERDVPTNQYTVKYQHMDALGSPIWVTDAGRTVIERSEYEPYGKRLASSIPAVKDGVGYTGHVEDAATGMTYMQQRYYDPQVGRFLSVDPVTADGNTGGNFSRYWYANNNPYKFTDPDGRLADIVLDVGFVAYSGYKLATQPSWTNAAALGADIVGAAVPFATGLGAAVRAGAHGADAARAVDNAGDAKPLMGRNDTSGPKSSRHNTDAGPNGNRATAKSIFRNQAEGKRTTTATADGGTRTRAENGVQIRHNPDGSSRVELPGRGTKPNGETIHTPTPPKPELKR